MKTKAELIEYYKSLVDELAGIEQGKMRAALEIKIHADDDIDIYLSIYYGEMGLKNRSEYFRIYGGAGFEFEPQALKMETAISFMRAGDWMKIVKLSDK